MKNFARGVEYTVPEDHYLMLGDNSRFSMDSRYFGPVPRRNLIGRAWLVFYPFSRRVGVVDRNEPLDMPTGKPGTATFPVMSKQ
jgi:signal peptidase I